MLPGFGGTSLGKVQKSQEALFDEFPDFVWNYRMSGRGVLSLTNHQISEYVKNIGNMPKGFHISIPCKHRVRKLIIEAVAMRDNLNSAMISPKIVFPADDMSRDVVSTTYAVCGGNFRVKKSFSLEGFSPVLSHASTATDEKFPKLVFNCYGEEKIPTETSAFYDNLNRKHRFFVVYLFWQYIR